MHYAPFGIFPSIYTHVFIYSSISVYKWFQKARSCACIRTEATKACMYTHTYSHVGCKQVYTAVLRCGHCCICLISVCLHACMRVWHWTKSRTNYHDGSWSLYKIVSIKIWLSCNKHDYPVTNMTILSQTTWLCCLHRVICTCVIHTHRSSHP